MSPTSSYIPFLRIGAALNFIIAAGHLTAMFFLDAAFRFYEIDEQMWRFSVLWAPLPYLIPVVLAFGFAVAGGYALAAGGAIRHLPFEKFVVSTVFLVFAGRVAVGIVNLIFDFPLRDLVSVLVALAVAVCYAPAFIARAKTP